MLKLIISTFRFIEIIYIQLFELANMEYKNSRKRPYGRGGFRGTSRHQNDRAHFSLDRRDKEFRSPGSFNHNDQFDRSHVEEDNDINGRYNKFSGEESHHTIKTFEKSYNQNSFENNHDRQSFDRDSNRGRYEQDSDRSYFNRDSSRGRFRNDSDHGKFQREAGRVSDWYSSRQSSSHSSSEKGPEGTPFFKSYSKDLLKTNGQIRKNVSDHIGEHRPMYEKPSEDKKVDDQQLTKPSSVGLPSVFQYSWQVFTDKSYTDSINCTVDDHEILHRESVEYLNKWIENTSSATDLNGREFLQEKFFIQDNNFITDEGAYSNVSEENLLYSVVVNKLNKYSNQIFKAQKQLNDENRQYLLQQNKLLMLALLKNFMKSESAYKVSVFFYLAALTKRMM